MSAVRVLVSARAVDSPVDCSPIKLSQQPLLALTGLDWTVPVWLGQRKVPLGFWTGTGWARFWSLVPVQRETTGSRLFGSDRSSEVRGVVPGGEVLGSVPAAEPVPVLALGRRSGLWRSCGGAAFSESILGSALPVL